MNTVPCTVAEFNIAFCEFSKAAGDKRNSQEGIANMHKGLLLHYLGIQDASDEQIERCAMAVELATSGAFRRGWALEVPDLSGRRQ